MVLLPVLLLALLALLITVSKTYVAATPADGRIASSGAAFPTHRQPRIAVVNSRAFHLEVVAGMVDATAAFRNSTTFFLVPELLPPQHRDRYGSLSWIQDAKCEMIRPGWASQLLIRWNRGDNACNNYPNVPSPPTV